MMCWLVLQSTTTIVWRCPGPAVTYLGFTVDRSAVIVMVQTGATDRAGLAEHRANTTVSQEQKF